MKRPTRRIRFFIEREYFYSLLGILLIFSSQSLLAASNSKYPELDSLKELIANPDLSQLESAWAMARLGDAYNDVNSDSAIHYGSLAVEAFEKLPNSEKKAKANIWMAETYYYLSRYKEAEPWINGAELAMEGVSNDTVMGKIFFVKGNVLARLDKFEESISYYEKSVELNTSVEKLGKVGNSYTNMGMLYRMLGKPEMALEYYDRGIEISREQNDSSSIAVGLLNQGSILSDLGDSSKANQNYRTAIDIFLSLPNKERAVYPLINLGFHAIKIEELGQARFYFEKAERIAKESSSEGIKMVALRGMADLLTNEGRFSSARIKYEEAWAKVQEFGQLSSKIGLLKEWVGMEEKAGDFAEALRLERIKNKLELEIGDLDRTKFVEELTVKYETESKVAENELLKEREAKLEARQKWIYGLGALISLFLLAIIWILFVANKRRKSFNNELEAQAKVIAEKNRTLESQNQLLVVSGNEKDALMGVVAHDLKAPLTKIMAMVHILEQVRADDERFSSVSGMIKNVVGGGERLIEELVLMSSLEKSDEALEMVETRIDPLLDLSVQGFQAQAHSKEITLNLNVSDDTVKGIVHPDHFSRVIDNVLSNAIKFSPSGSKVDLDLTSLNAQHFSISIRDNGPGIPAEELPHLFHKFSRLSPRPTAGESSTGLGMSIARELVHKMNGTIEVYSQLQAGTQFLLTFPRA